MKTFLALFAYSVFCYVTFFIIGYKTATLDAHLRVLNDSNVLKTLKRTCSELIETNPDYTQVEIGMKAFCYEYEQSKK